VSFQVPGKRCNSQRWNSEFCRQRVPQPQSRHNHTDLFGRPTRSNPLVKPCHYSIFIPQPTLIRCDIQDTAKFLHYSSSTLLL